jgi:hypothetical protein
MWININIFVDNVYNPVDSFTYRHLVVYIIVDNVIKAIQAIILNLN